MTRPNFDTYERESIARAYTKPRITRHSHTQQKKPKEVAA